jgi:hypothetical protein
MQRTSFKERRIYHAQGRSSYLGNILFLPKKNTEGKDQCFNKIDISPHCKEKYLEICAVQLETKLAHLTELSSHGDVSPDFNL